MKSLEDFLPYSTHITPEIIKCKGGSYLITFMLKGTTWLGTDDSIIQSRVNQINNFIMRLRAPTRYNMYIHTHCIRDLERAGLENSFEEGFAKELDRAYQNLNFDTPVMGSTYYISVIYRPYRRMGRFSVMSFSTETAKRYAEQAEEELGKVINTVLTEFGDYGVRPLSCFEQNGVVYSEPLQFLNRLISFENLPVAVQRATIDQYLAQATIGCGNNDLIEVSASGRKYYATMISLFEYPNASFVGCLQALMEAPCKAIVSQAFVPMDKADAQGWLKRERNRMMATDDVSEQEIMDMNMAFEGVTADNFVLGEFYWQCTLIHPDPELLRKYAADVIAILSAQGFNASVNRIAKAHSFFSNLPANISYFPRTARVSSRNVADLMPFLVQSLGKREGNAWGSAITVMRTINGEAFYFNFHDTDPRTNDVGKLVAGNTVISGQTGTGKTVLLSFLMAQSQRLTTPPRLFIFDMDLGSSVFVKAMKGKYSQIKLGESTGFNPFHLENTSENRAFLKELIMAILGDDVRITPKQVNQVEEAINQTMAQPQIMRDIEAFANFLPDGDDSVRQRLKAWTTGEYAWVFNNAEDNFSLDASIIGIDYTQFLDIPALSSPILMYLFHRIAQATDGTPFIISLDEAWRPLKSAQFQSYIERKMRTIRKENGLLILTTQSPVDFYNNVSEAIMGQVVTQIFLPNPAASEAVYCEKLGLSAPEFMLIKDMPKASRQFLVRYQHASTVCQLNLRGLKEVDVLSGSEARADLADKLIAENPEGWLEDYYKAMAQPAHI